MRRDNLLWTGSRMMLAEHRQLLNEKINDQKDEYDIKRVYDEQQSNEWQKIWNESINNNFEVVIKLNNRLSKKVTGKIVDWNLEQEFFYLQLKNGEKLKILVSEINDLIIK